MQLSLIELEVPVKSYSHFKISTMPARGVWSTFERTFFDVRIFNAKSLSYQSKTLPQLYTLLEKEKKNQYMNRVLQLERGHSSALYLPLQEEWHLRPGVPRFIRRLAALIV